MTSRPTVKKLAERILDDFSHQITAELYWKLYIISHFTHSSQRQKPSYIKKALKRECENFNFKKYSSITSQTLKNEVDKYMNNNNSKINRILTCNAIECLPKTLQNTQIEFLITNRFPSPYTAGYLIPNWTNALKEKLKEYYFGNSESISKIHIGKAYEQDELLKYYLSKRYYDFFYVHIQVATYEMHETCKKDRQDRRYDHTYVAIIMQYKDNKLTFLDKNFNSWGTNDKFRFMLREKLFQLTEKLNLDIERHPLFFIHNPDHILQDNFWIERRDFLSASNETMSYESVPFSIFCFEKFEEVLNLLKNMQKDKKKKQIENLILFLKDVEKKYHITKNIIFKPSSNQLESSQQFAESITDAFFHNKI